MRTQLRSASGTVWDPRTGPRSCPRHPQVTPPPVPVDGVAAQTLVKRTAPAAPPPATVSYQRSQSECAAAMAPGLCVSSHSAVLTHPSASEAGSLSAWLSDG